MLFSSTIFLFAFLPIVLAGTFALRTTRRRNVLLLLASLFFYAWGETGYIALLLLSIAFNYVFGLWIEAARGGPSLRTVLAFAVSGNLLLLGAFKYANFAVDNLNLALQAAGIAPIELAPVHLPIGISFFTFQSLTYVVDVYRRDAPAQRNPLTVALYISLFPQLIAGPIVRYRQVAEQLVRRSTGLSDLSYGVQRFIVGLGKKVLIANTLALPADRIFALPVQELQPQVAWLGVTCYALQIYFDFSGYSDMAFGLGRMVGFRFPENFQYPYISGSIREFWRRWHISLCTFFRDYVYAPLGGASGSSVRTHVNLVTVFLLCGLWHGASWNFAIWGLIHGAFMVIERAGLGVWLARSWRPLRSLYVWLVVLVSFVFFRAETLEAALGTLGAMAGMPSGEGLAYPAALFLNREISLVLVLALVGSTPWLPALEAWIARRIESRPPAAALRIERGYAFGRFALLNLVLLGCAMSLASGTHNPFIYFRF
jgi:alginate O-acetyltransferase complex protein AlgI